MNFENKGKWLKEAQDKMAARDTMEDPDFLDGDDKVLTFVNKDYSTVQSKFKINYEKILKCEEEKIIEKVNEKMELSFDSLNKKMKYIARGKELLDDSNEIKENIDKLEKIYDYLKYSAEKYK